MHLRVLPVVLVLAASACGSEREAGPDPVDAGIDADVPAFGANPTPPAEVRPGPCPEGWQEIAVYGGKACEPWSSTGTCPEGHVRYPGGDCHDPTDRCPVGAYAEGLGGSVLYVSSSAVTDGDGSEQNPIASLATAIARAGNDTTIALSTGSHEVSFAELPSGVTLAGACAAKTSLESSLQESGRALLATRAGSSRASGLTLRSDLIGIVAAGGSLELEDVVVEEARGTAVLAFTGGTITGTDVRIFDTSRGGDGKGAGLLSAGGSISLERVIIKNTPSSHLLTSGTGSHISLSDALLQDAAADATGKANSAFIQDGTLELQRTLIEGATEVAVLSFGAQTTVSLEDTVIRKISKGPVRAAGILNGQGSALALRRVHMEDIEGIGVQHVDGAIDAEDLSIRALSIDSGSTAIFVARGASGTLSRLSIDDIDGYGLVVDNSAGIAAADVHVHDVRSMGEQIYGQAILVVRSASLMLDRGALVQVGSGVSLGAEALLSTSDLRIESTTAQHDEELVGLGIVVVTDSTATLDNVLVTDAAVNGIVVEGPGASLSASRLTIEKTRMRTCSDGCGDLTFGSGLVGVEGTASRVEDFVIRDNALAGVRLLSASEFDLEMGQIIGHAVGADIQSDDFDIARFINVAFVENDRNISKTSRPAPDVKIPSGPGI